MASRLSPMWYAHEPYFDSTFKGMEIWFDLTPLQRSRVKERFRRAHVQYVGAANPALIMSYGDPARIEAFIKEFTFSCTCEKFQVEGVCDLCDAKTSDSISSVVERLSLHDGEPLPESVLLSNSSGDFVCVEDSEDKKGAPAEREEEAPAEREEEARAEREEEAPAEREEEARAEREEEAPAEREEEPRGESGDETVSEDEADFVTPFFLTSKEMEKDPRMSAHDSEEDFEKETVQLPLAASMDDTESDGLSSDDDSFRVSSATVRTSLSVAETAETTKAAGKKRKHSEKKTKPKSVEKKPGEAGPKQHAKQHESLLRLLTPFMVPPGPGAICVQTHRVVGVDLFVPESLQVQFVQFPKKPKTGKSLERYERYKHATTVKEMFDVMMLVNTLTAARLDFQNDLHAGLVCVSAPVVLV